MAHSVPTGQHTLKMCSRQGITDLMRRVRDLKLQYKHSVYTPPLLYCLEYPKISTTLGCNVLPMRHTSRTTLVSCRLFASSRRSPHSTFVRTKASQHHETRWRRRRALRRSEDSQIDQPGTCAILAELKEMPCYRLTGVELGVHSLDQPLLRLGSRGVGVLHDLEDYDAGDKLWRHVRSPADSNLCALMMSRSTNSGCEEADLHCHSCSTS